jgi:hypothetical protein
VEMCVRCEMERKRKKANKGSLKQRKISFTDSRPEFFIACRVDAEALAVGANPLIWVEGVAWNGFPKRVARREEARNLEATLFPVG